MTRQTSVEAFYDMVESGKLSTRRSQVFGALVTLPRATANEIFEHLKETRGFNLRYDSNTRARFTELREMGFIRETGTRECTVTHRTCLTYEVIPQDEFSAPAVVCRCPTCGAKRQAA